VNQAIDNLKSSGTLKSLQNQYLSAYTSIPVIQP